MFNVDAHLQKIKLKRAKRHRLNAQIKINELELIKLLERQAALAKELERC
jgi:hypothetical protein